MVTRRKFLRAGAFVALSAAVPLNTALIVAGQELGQREFTGIQNNPIPSQTQDPLAYYNQSAFESHLNSIFRLETGYSTIEVTLVEVKDLAPEAPKAADGRECFTLLFVGDTAELKQGSYRLEHHSLGSFVLFLVPGGPDKHGAQSYLATINRIPFGPGLSNGPGRATKPNTTRPGKPSGTKSAQPTTPKEQTTPTDKVSPSPRPGREGKVGLAGDETLERFN